MKKFNRKLESKKESSGHSIAENWKIEYMDKELNW